jgi:hypothetical protein
MLDAVAVDALVAIKLVPIFIRESLAKVSCSHVRVAQSWHYRVVTKVKFVILLKIVLHDLFIKDAFARSHNRPLKGTVLNCQQTPKQKHRPVFPTAEFEWFIARRFLRSRVKLPRQSLHTDFTCLMR